MESRVLIAGGGVAAIEAALALRALAGDGCRIEIFSLRHDFAYRPNAVGQPFELAEIGHHDLHEMVGRIGAHLHIDGISSVDVRAASATTDSGETFAFDYLIAATGAQPSSPVPGAVTFWGGDDGEEGKVINDLIEGRIESLALAAPGTESWEVPIYELALLTEAKLSDDLKSKSRLIIVTPEEMPLRVFGRAVSEAISDLLAARGIEILLATHSVEFDGGHLSTVPAGELAVDAVITLPRLAGRHIEGLPHDESGFIPVDDHCRVLKYERIYAAGDITSFPVKQGGIATQQADVAAESIAADLGVVSEPATFDPILRGVLWTGEGNLYLEGWLRGGHGESSQVSTRRTWRGDENKIVGRYLTPFLAGEPAPGDR